MREPIDFHGRPRPLAADEYLYDIDQVVDAYQDEARTSFELYVRTLPEKRNYLIAAGLEEATSYLRELRFDQDSLAWLANHPSGQEPLLDRALIDRLRNLRFQGDVDAVREGTVVGPNTPLMRIVATHFEATLVEAALLSIVNHQTLIASKAARIVQAAQARPTLEFGLRRSHGIDAGLRNARSAYIAGFSGTSNLEAAHTFGIPTSGTMAHQYVLRYGEAREQQAFENWLRRAPKSRRILLVDTYHTIRGIERAIAASKATGIPLSGIRLDSGDLLSLSIRARQMLDAAGFAEAIIVASNDLDEYKISELLEAGAPIDRFGVGTMLAVSADAPHIGPVYKLGAFQEDPTLAWVEVTKKSAGKATEPGMHQVFREFNSDGTILRDTLALVGESLPGQPLLVPVLRSGALAYDFPTATEIRDFCAMQRATLTADLKKLNDASAWPLGRSRKLKQLREKCFGSGNEIAA